MVRSERSRNRKDPEWIKPACCFYEVSDVDPELNVQLWGFQPLQRFGQDLGLLKQWGSLCREAFSMLVATLSRTFPFSAHFPLLLLQLSIWPSFTGVIHYRLHSDAHTHPHRPAHACQHAHAFDCEREAWINEMCHSVASVCVHVLLWPYKCAVWHAYRWRHVAISL